MRSSWAVALSISVVVHGAVLTSFAFIPWNSYQKNNPQMLLSKGDSAIQVRILMTPISEPPKITEYECPPEEVSDLQEEIQRLASTAMIEATFIDGVESGTARQLEHEQKPANTASQEVGFSFDEDFIEWTPDKLALTDAARMVFEGIRSAMIKLDRLQQDSAGESLIPPPQGQIVGTLSRSSPQAKTKQGVRTGIEVLNLPRPKYPLISRRRGEEGIVLLEVEVHPDGSSGQIKVISEPGHSRLRAAAIDAAEKASFRPARINGRPIRDVVRIPFRFALR